MDCIRCFVDLLGQIPLFGERAEPFAVFVGKAAKLRCRQFELDESECGAMSNMIRIHASTVLPDRTGKMGPNVI